MDAAAQQNISEIKPTDGEQLKDYMKKIKEGNKPKNYYVKISISEIEKVEENFKVNVYTEDKMNLLTIEFERNESQKKEDKERLIIGKSEGIVRFGETKKILSDFLSKLDEYYTEDFVKPEIYLEKLCRIGWDITPEGIDFMQITKASGLQAIRRTEFFENELRNFNL